MRSKASCRIESEDMAEVSMNPEVQSKAESDGMSERYRVSGELDMEERSPGELPSEKLESDIAGYWC